MTVEEYRTAGYAAADQMAAAMKAQVDAACLLIGNAQVDVRLQTEAVKIERAAEMMDVSERTVQNMMYDGRLVHTSEKRIPLWSIRDFLHKTPVERRKKPVNQTSERSARR